VPWSPFFALAKLVAISTLGAAATPPGELRDIASQVEMADDPVWHFYLAGTLSMLCVVAGVVAYARRRRVEPPAPTAPPHETALAALQELEHAALDARAFYTRLVDILRAYIATRFGVDAPDDTASELLAALFQAVATSDRHQSLLRSVVNESDLVKFAGRVPAADAPARALSACREYILDTEASHAL
jgi:hypothetical protein